jgi:hypothetical protein
MGIYLKKNLKIFLPALLKKRAGGSVRGEIALLGGEKE